MDGILVVNKPEGFTSFDVVAKMRGIIHQKKIGHTGTLDPDATGVLPVLLGRATRLADLFADDNKTYEAVIRLGVKTDTLDMSGTVLETSDALVSEDEFLKVLPDFMGEISQIPPMYSAIKVDGKKLYELARAGKEVERKPRQVYIEEISLEEFSYPLARIKVSCSKGTYIRTLASDIGEKLGCHGAVEKLVRTRCGEFGISSAITLDEIQRLADEGELESVVLPLSAVLSRLKYFSVSSKFDKMLFNGNVLTASEVLGESEGEIANGERVVLLSEGGSIIGIYEKRNGNLKPWKMLL